MVLFYTNAQVEVDYLVMMVGMGVIIRCFIELLLITVDHKSPKLQQQAISLLSSSLTFGTKKQNITGFIKRNQKVLRQAINNFLQIQKSNRLAI